MKRGQGCEGVKRAPVGRVLDVVAVQEPPKKFARTTKTGDKRRGEGEDDTFVGEGMRQVCLC
jgi:hypothetical protein